MCFLANVFLLICSLTNVSSYSPSNQRPCWVANIYIYYNTLCTHTHAERESERERERDVHTHTHTHTIYIYMYAYICITHTL
jgi:hypothetical protein